MFRLIYISRWIFKMYVARKQAGRRDCHWSVPLSITLCSTPTHTSFRCRLKSFISCILFAGRFASPDFVMTYIQVRAVRWPKIWKFIRSLTLLHYRTRGSEWCTEFQVDTARGKDNDQHNLSKMIIWYRSNPFSKFFFTGGLSSKS